jgi:MFS family permease
MAISSNSRHLIMRADSGSETIAAEPTRSTVLMGFLSFAAAYFISYLFRNVNSVIADQLIAELALDPARLGLLTAMYFLLSGAAQIPVGLMIDRFGSRRIVGRMLLLSMIGAAAFSLSSRFAVLVLARALIGLGVAGAFMGGLKVLLIWYPKERLPLVNGWLIAFGGLGAVAATLPAEFCVEHIGWRAVFAILAVATGLVAAMIFSVVPKDRAPASGVAPASILVVLRTVLADRRFWRLAPLSAVWVGSLWAFQGLWAERWFVDVQGIDHHATMIHLVAMAAAFVFAAPCLGAAAGFLRRTTGLAADIMMALLVAILTQLELVGILTPLELALGLRWPGLSYGIPAVLAAASSATALSFTALADYFPRNIAGAANGVLNTLHISVAFAIQSVVGIIVGWWNPDALGHYPLAAYQIAFGTILVLQLATLLWFIRFAPNCRPTRRAAAEVQRSGAWASQVPDALCRHFARFPTYPYQARKEDSCRNLPHAHGFVRCRLRSRCRRATVIDAPHFVPCLQEPVHFTIRRRPGIIGRMISACTTCLAMPGNGRRIVGTTTIMARPSMVHPGRVNVSQVLLSNGVVNTLSGADPISGMRRPGPAARGKS